MSALSPDQVNSIRAKLIDQHTKPDVRAVVTAVRKLLPALTQTDLIASADQILANTIGFGPIDELLITPGLTDVLVNKFDEVWFDRGAGLEKSELSWDSEAELREYAARLAASVNRRLDDVNPFVDAQLLNGVRYHAIIPPLSKSGTVMSFRIPAQQYFTFAQLVQSGTVDSNIAILLKQLINKKVSFAISGSTGSGKTTFLGALLGEVSPTERIVVIEDSVELTIDHPHVVSLQARNANAEGVGSVELKQLVKQALRMRPDRLVIGEVRGTEVLDLLIALNTGHEGGCVTIHANNTESVIARFEALGLLAKVPKAAIHALVKQAIKVLIHIERTPTGRRVSEISVLAEKLDGSVQVNKALDLLNNQRFQPGWQQLQKLVSS